MRSRWRHVLRCVLLGAALGANPSGATTSLTTTLVASGFQLPLFVTQPHGDARLFVVEQRSGNEGRVRIVKDGLLLARPFLRVSPVATGGEQGLLGLAFPPDYAASGRFYVHYTDGAGTTRLARYTVSADPDSANPTGQIIYSALQPFANHNGGWIAFGPDGFLWMALGDGGSAGDPGDRAQNTGVPLGKILRFDVSGNGNAAPAPGNPFAGATPGLDEIWCFGLRNPWRCSFDRETGDLVIADVGQNAWEEIDFAPASAARGKGWDWGWRCYEGSTFFSQSANVPCDSCRASGCPLRFPAWVYPHTLGRCSVTGGYVYRGCQIPDLRGTYFFADYCGAQIYSGKFVNGVLTSVADRTAELDPAGALSIGSISSFGEDDAGELYICDLPGGEVFKIVPRTAVTEADMPQLRVATAAGDTLGATGAGNAIAPGITPFAAAGSRIAGAGFLAAAAIRACPESTPSCLTTHMRLGVWEYDMTACVEPDSERLTRTFVFRNATQAAQPLRFVDVVAPLLGNEDLGRAYALPTPTETVLLAIYEATAPSLFVTLRGMASAGIFDADVDSRSVIEARVAADEPLQGNLVAGPGVLAMALSFDFGTVGPAAQRSVMLATRLLGSAPTSADAGHDLAATPVLRVVGPMPFRSELRLAIALPRAASVQVDVFDVRGRAVRRLVEGVQSAGTHPVIWDGRDAGGRSLGSGLYLVRLHGPAASQTLRVVRVR